jgi:4-amino-4-deoxy-L-arabinose transferase-like glycosyltransferase
LNLETSGSSDAPEPQTDARAGCFARRLTMIILLGAGLRAAVFVGAECRPDRFDFPDSHRYMAVARNIAAGEGPIESEQVRAGTDPLYPYMLAVGVKLGCDGDAALMRFGRLLNALAGLASVILLTLLARRLAGDGPALAAALILAIDPILLFFNGLVLTEAPYTAMLLAGVYCIIRVGGQRDGIYWATAAGAFLGAATLMRSTNLFMPIAMLPFVWHFAKPGLPHRIRMVAMVLAVAAAMLIPTTTRNYRLFGSVVPVRTGSGAALMEALGPWADGSPGMDRIRYPEFPAGAGEIQRDRLCRQAAFTWAAEHPRQVLALAWAKLGRTWSITISATDYSSRLYKAIAWLTVAPEFALALGGLGLLRGRRAVVALLLVPAIYFTLVHMVFVGSVRYRVPAMPFLFVLAGVALHRMIRGLRQPRVV